jgi:geranylgeranyl diphosphate synthase type I
VKKDKREFFLEELKKRQKIVHDYLMNHEDCKFFAPKHIHDVVHSYLKLGGKMLRPAVMMFSCGAVGGDEMRALPAAAAVEVYHTWTLMHDDIIDRDLKRRGGITAHEEFRQKGMKELNLPDDEAKHYGLAIAMLGGDVQQGWVISMLTELYTKQNLPPDVVFFLLRKLEIYVQNQLISGEALDVQYSKMPFDKLNEGMILEMLRQKTGVLLQYAGLAGAVIGLKKILDEKIDGIANFTEKCGIAFQLQDDILGIVGDEEKLGKPVGSDIREGKRTVVVLNAFRNATNAEKAFLNATLGNPNATAKDIEKTIEILRTHDSLEYTEKLAQTYIQDALDHLNVIPDSEYKDLLLHWADFMINREF